MNNASRPCTGSGGSASSWGLDVISQILEGLEQPQSAYRTIHVAGTNGKGSVASMLAGILQTAGFSVGLYTSPHLIHFNERIRIDGRPVTDPEIVEAYRAIRKVQKADREPTFFEFTTAMALHLFKQHRVDWAVVETGMGGRLDATKPAVPRGEHHHQYFTGAQRLPGQHGGRHHLREGRHHQARHPRGDRCDTTFRHCRG